MVSKLNIFFHPHNVVFIILIILFEVFQNLNLNPRLMLKLFLIPNNLQSKKDLMFVVKAFNSLPKGSFT